MNFSVLCRVIKLKLFFILLSGFWIVHCHFEWHLAIGMSFVVQIGEIEDMVKPPKDFPKCGNYKMNVRDYNLD